MTGHNVTRVDLYEAVYQKVGLSRSESLAMVELILKEITGSLEKGETVKLSSFGSFTVRKKKQRIGRNPKTGARVEVPAKKIPYFKPSKELKDVVNNSATPAVTVPPPTPDQAPNL